MQVRIIVCAALLSEENRVFIARRPPGKPLAGLWEFPGGKIEIGETPEQALARELHEELGIHTKPDHLLPFTFTSSIQGDFQLLLLLYTCTQWQGTAHGKEGQETAWVSFDKLVDYPMPDTNIPFIERLLEKDKRK
jgi:8-oxo-dGTP diphosphatase